MLVTLVPLFDEDMSVRAYSLFTQKNNTLLNPSFNGTSYNDGAVQVTGLEMINSMGIDTLATDKEIFVSVNSISLTLLPSAGLRIAESFCFWMIPYSRRKYLSTGSAR